MHQHHHRPIGRTLRMVVHAMARNRHRAALSARKRIAQIHHFIEVAHWPLPESEPCNHQQRHRRACQPLQSSYAFTPPPAFISAARALCQPVSITRTVTGSSVRALWLFHSARSTQRTASASDAACNCAAHHAAQIIGNHVMVADALAIAMNAVQQAQSIQSLRPSARSLPSPRAPPRAGAARPLRAARPAASNGPSAARFPAAPAAPGPASTITAPTPTSGAPETLSA